MDGITEPVVLILGHPIAGNPSQFAFERAFESMRVQWRVLSCDVPAEHIDRAIAGAEVLGFRGLLLDRNVVGVDDAGRTLSDFWIRDSDSEGGWRRENLFSTWLESAIRQHFESRELNIGPLLWIGTPDPRLPGDLASETTQSPIAWASREAIEHAAIIAVTEPVDVSEWPACQSDTLVIDFANPANDAQRMRDLGYNVLGCDEARIGVLMLCLQRLTGKQPPVDVLVDAIEEYLAV